MKFQEINPNRAIEDYLETIYELSKQSPLVKASDIALKLNVKKSSVSQMLTKLLKLELIKYQKYKPVELTTTGLKIGKNIHDKHQTLEKFFDNLSIPKKIQLKDIHGIEHYLSHTTIRQIKRLNTMLQKNNIKIPL